MSRKFLVLLVAQHVSLLVAIVVTIRASKTVEEDVKEAAMVVVQELVLQPVLVGVEMVVMIGVATHVLANAIKQLAISYGTTFSL